MEENETAQRLKALSSSIQQVYLPLLESKTETKLQMEKFVRQISISLQQAYGNVSIKEPIIPEDKTEEQIQNDKHLCHQYGELITEWASIIKKTMETENAKTPEMNTATGTVEYWRTRSATFNTLHQQLTMPKVRKVLNIMQEKESKSTNQDELHMDNFNNQWTAFSKTHSQAKDFVKFLTTLERQFKNISKGVLPIIEETLPSLLNGLKLIWTISRHISTQEGKMEDLLESISNEICEKVRQQIDVRKIFKIKPDDAILMITQGITVLEKWQKQYQLTKLELEGESAGIKRWNFNTTTKLFAKPKYMRKILENLKEACIIMKHYFNFLGPDLKAVTGNQDMIDEKIEKVKESINKLETFQNDLFNEDYEENWNTTYEQFTKSIQQIQQETLDLIDNTFQKNLNSAEGAFDLLQKFNNIETRPAIVKQLENKYQDVLGRYELEVNEMGQLFKKGYDNPPISKNMPPTAGAIAWARSIMGRIKSPIYKFKTYDNILVTPDGKRITKKYIALAKELDRNYEAKKFDEWDRRNSEHALDLLKWKILKKEEGKGYEVNFSPDLKVIIREAKFLDRIGKEIPQTIINIALQETDYLRHVDSLNQLLREYNAALGQLKPVEKKLLEKRINTLNRWMDKGVENHNWFSLSIKEYVKDCKDAIEDFIQTKQKVMSYASNIETKVHNIENAIIVKEIDFAKKEPMDIIEFSEFFDTYRTKVLQELVKDYQTIGDISLKSIADSTGMNKESTQEMMRPYYAYWERRIFNAITKMIIRALAANKTLFVRNQAPFLLKINSKYSHPDLTYQPSTDELVSQLEKFSRNILESAKQFGRWWDGYCIIFEEKLHPETSEKQIPFTFFDDVMVNPVITTLHYDICQARAQVIDKITYHTKGWVRKIKFKLLWDKAEQSKLQKSIDKAQSTADIEKYILNFKQYKKEIKKIPNEGKNFFILVDYTKVKKKTLKRVYEWFAILGKSMTDIATKELSSIIHDTSEFNRQINMEIAGKQELQALLDVIDKIKTASMDMEFRITEVQEQFRILKMYKYDVDPEAQKQVDDLMKNWNDLMNDADKKDFDMNEYKISFSEQTKGDVLKFKHELKEEYEKYVSNGPGAEHVQLEEGLEILAQSKETMKRHNRKREEMVMAEKLFNLPISKYPELIRMDEDNKIYDLIYGIYKAHTEAVKELSMMAWSKLDINELNKCADTFEKQVRKLQQKLPNPENIPPNNKLKTVITGFKDSLPLINQLKIPAVQERHWKKIMEETGKDLGEINLKTITLSKVFELELQNYEDKVVEICKEANEEAKNEENLQKIEVLWKNQLFDIVKYKKGNDDKGWAIKAPDDIRQALEDNILILQSLSASRYIRNIASRVKQWEKDLNTINDVIDTWLVVQRKWMYLESIFSSDDIRLQLPDEAKKFSKTDVAYRKIMDASQKNMNVLGCCVKEITRLSELKNISADLDKCQKSLTNYLERKRMSFPRFYFISDDDLLLILGSSDPRAISPHLLKLFDNCKDLIFGKGDKQILGMVSDEGEQYDFETPTKPEGAVEAWMNRVDDEQKKTLQLITKKEVFYYAKEDRVEWIKKEKQLGMVSLLGTQIWWTFSVEDVFRQVQEGDKHAMKKELAKESNDLNNLISLVREDIDSITRKKVNTLIILDVHARDIVDRFVRDSILDAREFEWESQLRFYWDKKKDDVAIRQCTGQFDYCYEYQGLNGRLVITPLTDRCVMTLTTALTFKLGGAPAGPAGTGKTETVKDLAKSLAVRCVVTNCGETLDYVAMGIIFSGLIQTGFWGCFDEFNRINPEVLSVISTQITTIQVGLNAEKKKIYFIGEEMRLVHTVGIFVTMNPGYAGRSELPDNLKALFRPVTMIVPDLILICENMLMSEGFTLAKVLAKKMTVLYKLGKEQLSKQYHYDFGLRALKSVLVMAGQLKRSFSEMQEDIVLMRALRDMNMPKFVFEDVPLFSGLINDLFPGLKAERVGYEDLNNKITTVMENNKYKHSDEDNFKNQVNKCVQLFETMQTRHTTMIVGPTGAGKSVVILTLAASLKEDTGIPTRIDVINPKMVTLNELYGILDPESRDWTDGLLSKTFKDLNQDLPPGKPERRWIVYDGDVDAVWVENMNSVMDDNKILTLANGDRIRMQKHCAMLFEVYDLQYASPATISRCGMVYVDPKNLGYAPFYERWCKDKLEKYSQLMYDSLKELFEKYVPICIDRIFEGTSGDEIVEPLKFITPRTNLNLVQQLATLLDSIFPPPETTFSYEVDNIEKPYIFCLIWSLGGSMKSEDRDKFSDFVKNVSQLLLPANSLYDNTWDMEQMTFIPWERKVEEYVPPATKKFSQILVPTVDTKRYSWLLNQIMKLKKPAMFVGDSGTAKTVTIFSHFKVMPVEKYIVLNINFSSRTTSFDCQKTIEENIEKRSFKQYGPTGGRTLVVFVDDLNMPRIDKYGTQQPIALLKFLIERNTLYQRKGDLELREIVDTQYVGSMTPPGGGNNPVDPRFMSLFSCFNITFPSREAIEKIYTSILDRHVVEFSDDVKGIVPKITTATLRLYFNICEKLPRTPVKFHYIFNLRDLSRVYEGLMLITIDKCNTKDQLVRVWRNECMHVFSDRLINEMDRSLVNDQLLLGLVKELFPGTEETVMKNPILFGDYLLSEPNDDEAEDPRLYEDLGEYDDVKKKMNRMLEEYSMDNKAMNLVLFNDALEHLTKIHRIIRFPRGSGLLVGVGGSGKQSLTKLATFVAGYSLFTINLIRNYKEEHFREDLRSLYREILKKTKTFMFTDAHVVEEGFLELINNILTIGMVPALFPEEEKDGLTRDIEDELRKQGLPETKESKWAYFVNKCRDSIHIILAMSPASDTLRVRCRNFPGLVSNTSIDWFFPWPEDALSGVATNFLVNVNLEEEVRQSITDHIVMIHQSVQQYSVEFEQIYKRKNYSTPKNYLDFIDNYIKFLEKNRKQIDNQVRRLEGGLTTLAKAQGDTEILSKELAIKNEEIAEKKKFVEELIADITEKSIVAGKQQQMASEKKALLDVQSVEIAREEAEATKAFEEAAPILAAAKEALKDVSSKDISLAKTLQAPTKDIEGVCQILYYLYPNSKNLSDDSWGTVKLVLLGDPKMLFNLQEYQVENTKGEGVKKAKNRIAQFEKDLEATGKELINAIKVKSVYIGALFYWATSTIKCYEIFKDVEPKRKKAKMLKEQKAIAEKELADTEAKLKEVTEKLNDLNAKRKIKQDELDDLEAKQREMKRKLDAASRLITGLGSEQTRWTGDLQTLVVDKVKLVGDCLTGSAFISYCGAFNFELRQRMVYDHWKNDVVQKNIPNSEGFKLEKFLTNDVEMSKWASEGLPSDELSIQNGILTKNSSRWPLCIDPQMQAVEWIKEKERKSNQLDILSFNNADYIKKLEIAIGFGKAILFEAIDEELDPMIDPILEKNFVIQTGVKMLKLGDTDIEYHDEFRMYLTTKIANPNYVPEVYGKTMIINFNVTLQGLRDQLLNEVVGYERPDLERQRKQLVIETSQNRAILKELEDTLLSELSKETDIPLVDNVPLIETLENAKTKAVEIANALEIAKTTAIDIESNRENYKDVAKRGAILFFAMSGLSAISEMYEYSLSSYLTVFKNALETARKDTILPNRLKNIKDRLTILVYDFTCMGIFEKHKLTFSFQMTTMIMDGDGELNKMELDFFLKGNTSLDAVERRKPGPWLSDNGWKDLQKLVLMGDIWKNLVEDIEMNKKDWKAWYDLEVPESGSIPCGYSTKLNKFQQLLVIRIFRPDRVVNAIKNFIIDKMISDHYVQPPTIQYDKIYSQSTEKTPIVFILSPGADPLSDVMKLVDTIGLGQNKFKYLALGQGMGDKAKAMIENSAIKGHWVLLQNCHLLISWLKKLETIIEQVSLKPDKNFRLWLTTAPIVPEPGSNAKFPLGILQKSLKVVTEPPDGLRLNIKSSYMRLTDEQLDSCPHRQFKPLVYVLSFFHAVMQERKKFGKIGWNISYDFNESDFRISFRLISMYLEKAYNNQEETLPWETLRYLIGEAMYGGRVTDDFDRRVLVTYLQEYMGDFIFDSNQKFFFSKASYEYVIPPDSTLEQYLGQIMEIPLINSPVVFGLHPNAEIQYFTNSAKDIWLNTIEMQTSDASSGGGINKEQYIAQVASDLKAKIPEVFDYYKIKKEIEQHGVTPTQIVLLQELERFNKLLVRQHDSLKNLQRALIGEIGMSIELDELSNSLFNGFLPTMWSKLAPQTLKNLVNWMEHFSKRYQLYKFWIEEEEPKAMWLSGLHIPESYLTALVQTTCRSKGWALDKSTLYTLVTKIKNPNEIKKRLDQGCYIYGMYLEGAKWNMTKDCLDYQDPKELIVEMPLIQIVPIEANKLKLRGTLRTPVYVTSNRRNAMGVGLVFEADLKSDKHTSHWVLQGVCMVLNTD